MFSQITTVRPTSSQTSRWLQLLPRQTLFRMSTSSPSDSSNSSFRQGFSGFKPFMRPFSKVFLGAVFTYQVIYWTWLKLEMDESKIEKNKEVAALEKQAREMAAAQK